MKRTVIVKFDERGTLSEKGYAYFTDDPTINARDWVVVIVGKIPKTAMVTKTEGLSSHELSCASKWIVQRIDFTEYHLNLKRQELINEIENELNAEIKKIQRYEILKTYAKTSPVMADLLRRLQALDPSINLIED